MSGFHQVDVPLNGDDPVRLHMADLDVLFELRENSIRKVVSPDEQLRADKFVKPEHQQRFMAARYMLRSVLAETTGTRPENIEFAFNPFGKPSLSGNPVNFNMSHSDSFGVVGVSATRKIGVDIETRITLETANEIASRILTKREFGSWQQLPTEEMVEEFTKYWTLKESILKAYGEGLSQDPREIELSLNDARSEIRKLPVIFASPQLWSLSIVQLPEHFPNVALAVGPVH